MWWCCGKIAKNPLSGVIPLKNVSGIPDIVALVFRLKGLSSSARLLLVEILRQATSVNREGKLVARISPKRLSIDMGVCRRSVGNYLAELEGQGLISRHPFGTREMLVIIDVERIRQVANVSRISTPKKEKTYVENVDLVVEECQKNEETKERQASREPAVVPASGEIFLKALENMKKKAKWRENLVQELVEEFGDEKSREFYGLIVSRVSLRVIEEARRITRSACHRRAVRNPGAYFVGVLKKLLGIQGKFEVVRLACAH